LRTTVIGDDSYGPLVVAFAEAQLGVELMPWQRLVLDDVFTHNGGKFVHRTGLVSVARQNGKTTMLEAIVLWLLMQYPQVVGRPVHILSTAHHLDLAVESFTAIADILEERFGCKVTRAYGRNFVTAPDGSTWKVTASTGKKHGGTYDFILGDELWALTEAAVFGALRPSQIAVPNPLMLLFSTAGDESSTVFQQLREQGLQLIDKGQPGDLYFAEWSAPAGMDPGDERWWPDANPALGKTITMEGLRSAFNAPDKVQFMRAHLNQWVSAAGSWLEPGLWANLKTSEPMPAGGVLAIETSLDDSRFVGVRAAADGTRVFTQVEFVAGTEAEAWAEVQRIMADHTVHLAVTPSLEIHLPAFTNKRYTIVGYNELLKYTGLVRTMITEERVLHQGEQILAEHVNRAVLVKTVQGAVLSSQKSPGPIELTRCLVWATAMVSKPARAQKPLLVVGSR
jgi:phage terminase large subunit-like protein